MEIYYLLHDLFRCLLSSSFFPFVTISFITRRWSQLRVQWHQISGEQQEAIKAMKTTTWRGTGERILNWKAGCLGSGPSSVVNSLIHSLFEQHISSPAVFRHCFQSGWCSSEKERQQTSQLLWSFSSRGESDTQINKYKRIGWLTWVWLGDYLTWVVRNSLCKYYI